jgi:hypothetical protein
MSVLKNALSVFMPHLESRRTASTAIVALNGEVVHNVDGDESVVIFINAPATPNLTYSVQGSPDGTNYYDLVAYPYAPASVGGTLPQPGQPMVTEALTAIGSRMLCAAVGGLQKIRVRCTAWTSGSINVNINSDACGSISPYVRDQKAATLMVTATGAAGATVTATLPAVAGLRHYIDRISVLRSMTVLQAATATPTVVTTTNIPGTPALTFGTDAAAVGQDKELLLEFGGAGMATSTVNTATTVVCPVLANAIWRVNVAYRLGL